MVKVRNCEKHEAYLHDFFAGKERYFEPLRGNGATEVFRLTWLDLAICILYMHRIRILQDRRVQGLLFVIFWATFIVLLYRWDAQFASWLIKTVGEWMRMIS